MSEKVKHLLEMWRHVAAAKTVSVWRITCRDGVPISITPCNDVTEEPRSAGAVSYTIRGGKSIVPLSIDESTAIKNEQVVLWVDHEFVGRTGLLILLGQEMAAELVAQAAN